MNNTFNYYCLFPLFLPKSRLNKFEFKLGLTRSIYRDGWNTLNVSIKTVYGITIQKARIRLALFMLLIIFRLIIDSNDVKLIAYIQKSVCQTLMKKHTTT